MTAKTYFQNSDISLSLNATYIVAGSSSLQSANEYAEKNGGFVTEVDDICKVVSDDLCENFGPGYIVTKTKPRHNTVSMKGSSMYAVIDSSKD